MSRDLICAALGLALACAYYAAADALPHSLLADNVGADGVPKLLAVLLALLSIAIGARSALARPLAEGAHGGGVAPRRHLRAFGVAAIGTAYIAVVPVLGFAPALALLLLAAMLHYGAAPRLPVLLYASGGAAILWAVFALGLRLAMPTGLFG